MHHHMCLFPELRIHGKANEFSLVHMETGRAAENWADGGADTMWGGHSWQLLSKAIVSAGVPTMQLSCGKIDCVMGGCPGFNHNKREYPHTMRCFAMPLAAAWFFSSSSVRQNHNLSAVWFEKQVANSHLQGSSVKLVSIDDAQRRKELLNQWSERQRKKLRQRSQFSDLPRKEDSHLHPEEQSGFFCESCYNGFKLVLIGKTDCILSASLLLIEGPQRQKS